MRKVLIVLLVLLGVCIAAGVLVYRNGVHPQIVLWIVGESWSRTNSFEGTLEGSANVVGMDVSTAGRLRFMRPDLYDVDFNMIRVICGKDSLWVIVPWIKTGFRVHSNTVTPSQMLAGMVQGWEDRDPGTWVREATARPSEVTLYKPADIGGERCWVLEWPARTGERIGGRLYVSQRTRAPMRFDQMDSGGQTVASFTLKNFKRNVPMAASDFDYTPMSGYSVVEFEYDPNDPTGLSKLLSSGGSDASKLRDKAREYLGPGVDRWMQRHGLPAGS